MNSTESGFLLYIIGALLLFFIGRVAVLWYYKIDERITQQHETNRLLRKLAGEPPIESVYLDGARNNNTKTVSSKEDAAAPITPNAPHTTIEPAAQYGNPQ